MEYIHAVTHEEPVKQAHAPWNIIRRWVNLAQIILLLFDSSLEVQREHIQGWQKKVRISRNILKSIICG